MWETLVGVVVGFVGAILVAVVEADLLGRHQERHDLQQAYTGLLPLTRSSRDLTSRVRFLIEKGTQLDPDTDYWSSWVQHCIDDVERTLEEQRSTLDRFELDPSVHALGVRHYSREIRWNTMLISRSIKEMQEGRPVEDVTSDLDEQQEHLERAAAQLDKVMRSHLQDVDRPIWSRGMRRTKRTLRGLLRGIKTLAGRAVGIARSRRRHTSS